jgi:ankyrin repeat protein
MTANCAQDDTIYDRTEQAIDTIEEIGRDLSEKMSEQRTAKAHTKTQQLLNQFEAELSNLIAAGHPIDQKDTSALMIASEALMPQLMQILIRHGANIHARDEQNASLTKIIRSAIREIEREDDEEDYAYFNALSQILNGPAQATGYQNLAIQCLNILQDAGYPQKSIAQTIAKINKNRLENNPVVQLVQNSAKEIYALATNLTKIDRNNRTRFNKALNEGHHKIQAILKQFLMNLEETVKSGNDIDQKFGRENKNALMIASTVLIAPMIKILIDHGADLRAVDSHNRPVAEYLYQAELSLAMPGPVHPAMREYSNTLTALNQLLSNDSKDNGHEKLVQECLNVLVKAGYSKQSLERTLRTMDAQFRESLC